MRMFSGTDVAADGNAAAADAEWANIVAAPWLAETFKGLRSPDGLARIDPCPALNGTLRPITQTKAT